MGDNYMEFMEFTAKTVSEAITEACQKLGVTSDKLEYEVLDEGSAGFLGFGSKPAKIKANRILTSNTRFAGMEMNRSKNKIKIVHGITIIAVIMPFAVITEE